MKRGILAIAASSISLAGCVNMAAVGDFAKSSEVVASNSQLLDAGPVQSQTLQIARDAALPASETSVLEDPNSQEFEDQQAVTVAAGKALAAYMKALNDLTSLNTTKPGSDISSISASLTKLKVADAQTASALSATQALVNLLTSHTVQLKTRTLILNSADAVDQITSYLAAQAQQVAIKYDTSSHIDVDAWTHLMVSAESNPEKCRASGACQSLNRLTRRVIQADQANFAAKAAAARAASTAFQKIQQDNRLLATNVHHLTAKDVTAQLQADAPDLETAITFFKGA